MSFVQKVINSFLVNLKVTAGNGKFLATESGLMLDQFKNVLDRAGNNTFVFTRFNNSRGNPLVVG